MKDTAAPDLMSPNSWARLMSPNSWARHTQLAHPAIKIIPATNPNRIVKTHRYKELLEWGSIIHLTLRLGPMGVYGPHGPIILYYIILYVGLEIII